MGQQVVGKMDILACKGHLAWIMNQSEYKKGYP